MLTLQADLEEARRTAAIASTQGSARPNVLGRLLSGRSQGSDVVEGPEVTGHGPFPKRDLGDVHAKWLNQVRRLARSHTYTSVHPPTLHPPTPPHAQTHAYTHVYPPTRQPTHPFPTLTRARTYHTCAQSLRTCRNEGMQRRAHTPHACTLWLQESVFVAACVERFVNVRECHCKI